MNLWTNEDIRRILFQLDELGLPFKKYTFVRNEDGLEILGRGASANVYKGKKRGGEKKNFAIKVIGFGNQTVDSKFFRESVEAQKNIGAYKNLVVQVKDSCELWVTVDEHDNVIATSSDITKKPSERSIKLQFIVMERLDSVIERKKSGKLKLHPKELREFNEAEILKLGFDIGQALSFAHRQNVIHRDVKLENIFYDSKNDQYKLGDFGVAKKTSDGFVGTIAFTKGYVAPEVRGASEDDRYDKTADIYSFGMMLYVLANGLKFPESTTYNVNSSLQYTKGYILPPPENKISNELYEILVKACMYDPEDRYESMDELLLDLEKLMDSSENAYKKEHKSGYFVLSGIMLVMGMIFWKLSYKTEWIFKLDLWEYVFCFLCLGKGVRLMLKRDEFENNVLSFGLLVIGGYLLIADGFSLIKLAILLVVLASDGITATIISAALLLINFVSLIQDNTGSFAYSNYQWLTLTFITLAVFIFITYSFLIQRDRKLINKYSKIPLYWLGPVALYALIYFDQLSLCSETMKKASLAGGCVCVALLIREYLVISRDKAKNQV